VKKILLAMLFIGSSLLASIGDEGSKQESFQVMVKFELIKEDNSTVTILDGTEFLEVKSDLNTTGLGASLGAVRPANGNYKGIKYTVTKLKQKSKIVVGATTYYTKDKTIAEGDSFALGQTNDINSVSDYGYTTTTLPTDVTTLIFPKILTLASGSDASIIWVQKYTPNKVIYETAGTVEASTNIREDEILFSILPAMPTKTIVFDVNYTKDSNPTLTNTITAFLDKEGDLIGAYQMKPESNKALNGSDLTQGTKINNDYSIRIQNHNDSGDGINGDDYYDINVTLNCTNSTYSSLIINETQDGVSATALPNGQAGYTLTTSGNVICTDINITE
jgi:hypothetical protein